MSNQTQKGMAETFCALRPPWHKALWPVALQHSTGDLPVHGLCVSQHTFLHPVMCSFARWIIFNPWYNCWSDLSVTWQKVAAAVCWHQLATRVLEFSGNQSFLLKSLQTSVWGFYFTPSGAFCAATWREMKKTISRPVCTLNRKGNGLFRGNSIKLKDWKTLSEQNSGVLVSITSIVVSCCT